MKAWAIGLPIAVLLMCIDASVRFSNGDGDITAFGLAVSWVMWVLVLAITADNLKTLKELEDLKR